MVVIDIEPEGFDELARVMRVVPDQVMRELPRVGRKGAQNVKTEWAARVGQSRHFGQIAPTINYDERSAFGAYEAEVGPDRRRRAARLAGIAHFGGANGGGGTIGDPQRFADAEGPRMEQAIADLVDKVLGK